MIDRAVQSDDTARNIGRAARDGVTTAHSGPVGVPRKPRPLLVPRSSSSRYYRGEATLRSSVVVTILVFNVVLLLVPIGAAFVGSFHHWNPLNGTFEFLGLQNYATLLADPTFWRATLNTGVFGVVVIGFRVVIGLGVAYAIFSRLTRWKTFFRTVFYMPTVAPLIAVAYVWRLMYHPQAGAINTFLGLDVNWLLDSAFALPAVMVMTIWKDFGYAVILFLAGLYSLPEDALEAAAVDGANGWQRFRHVVLPLLGPMTLFVVVTSILSYLQAFVQVLVLTEGGPGTSTYIVSYLLFDEAFVHYNFGYASAISFVLLVFTGLLTLLSFRLAGGRALFGRSGG
jgi:multiple sugar transport system permease protein